MSWSSLVLLPFGSALLLWQIFTNPKTAFLWHEPRKWVNKHIDLPLPAALPWMCLLNVCSTQSVPAACKCNLHVLSFLYSSSLCLNASSTHPSMLMYVKKYWKRAWLQIPRSFAQPSHLEQASHLCSRLTCCTSFNSQRVLPLLLPFHKLHAGLG